MTGGFSEATRRVSYPRVADYCHSLSTVGVGLLGLAMFVGFLPAWWAGVWLPHPLLGALAAADAVWRTRSRWRAFRGLEVELYPEGIRLVWSDGATLDAYCADVYQLHQTRHGVTFFAAGAPIVLDAGWPGYREVVDHLVRYAGLADRTPRASLLRRLVWPNRYFERLT